MAFYKDERLALFIDGANLYSAARAVDLEIDFRKLLKEFQGKGRLLRANYYTALVETDEYSPIRPLVDWLAYNGYNVIKKPARLEMAANVDHIVLFSGNGDFRRAVEAVKARGVRVSVVSTVASNPPMIGDELRREADNFIDLEDLGDRVARPRQGFEGGPEGDGEA